MGSLDNVPYSLHLYHIICFFFPFSNPSFPFFTPSATIGVIERLGYNCIFFFIGCYFEKH